MSLPHPDSTPDARNLLRALPRVDALVDVLTERLPDAHPALTRPEILMAARASIEEFRQAILQKTTFNLSDISRLVEQRALEIVKKKKQSWPQRVINGTGIIVHTGLGRSLLSRAATEAVTRVAASHCALEVDVASGERGKRDTAVAALLREITGAEDATVCNNCAGATFLALNSLASGQKVICSRGELVEIGGGFRMPDVMEQSGCTLHEVGTTNKTRLSDYEAPFAALSQEMMLVNQKIGALLKVHTSNFRVVGFTAEVDLSELVKLGRERGVPVIEDLGSGVFMDLRTVDLPYEPRVQDSVQAGADVVCFSGDKLLGGPQCGILVGRKIAIDKIRKNPMIRALRCDKFTLAALEATLRHYRSETEAWREIPTLRALSEPVETVKQRARKLARLLKAETLQIAVRSSQSQAGAGALPTTTIPSFAVCLTPQDFSIDEFARRLRLGEPSVWGRIHEGALWLDARTVRESEVTECAQAVKTALRHG